MRAKGAATLSSSVQQVLGHRPNATSGLIASAGTGSPNLLLYTLSGGTPPPPPPVLDVAARMVSSGGVRSGKNWKPQASISVTYTSNNGPVNGVTVYGNFNPGGNATCVTSSAGTCTLTGPSISVSTTKLSITNVTGANLNYVSGTVQYTLTKP